MSLAFADTLTLDEVREAYDQLTRDVHRATLIIGDSLADEVRKILDGGLLTLDEAKALLAYQEPDQPRYDESPAGPPPALEDFAMTCCDSPDPAVLEKNNRMFCRSCRRYLDNPPETVEDDEQRGGTEARGAGGGDGADR